jgi:murein DD-endopeptidase MepM/ murein hydrolase activator NlpD
LARPGGGGAVSEVPGERQPLIRPRLAARRCARLSQGVLAASLTLILLAGPTHAQDSLPPVTLTLAPDSLPEGTLGWIRLGTPAGVLVRGGELASEPLHVQKLHNGSFRALVGIPVEAADSLPVSVILEQSGRLDTQVVFLRVTRSSYDSETLTVPPAYARPDSAASARIQSEIERSRKISRASQQRRQLWRGAFELPRTSRITSRFGTARVYNGQVQSRHLGTDFAGAVGAPVHAAGRGIVALVADFYLAGRAIYIDHGAGLVTAYFHLSRADVRQGQLVVTGQRIGAVGRSGRVTGPHLHWVARYGELSVDPMSLLQLVKSGR